VVTFLQCGRTRAELAITAVQNNDDTPATEGFKKRSRQGSGKAMPPSRPKTQTVISYHVAGFNHAGDMPIVQPPSMTLEMHGCMTADPGSTPVVHFNSSCQYGKFG
jgi:hypothetical protein